MRTWFFAALFLALCARIPAASTPGTVSFDVTTVTDGGKYAPKHVLAIWVADAKTNFVRTLKFNAAARVNYLNKWNAARGSTTGGSTLDGYSGATLSTHQTHHVTWNCKTAAGAIVADGTYRVFVEFTEINGQGPLLSTVTFDKGLAASTNSYASTANFTNLRVIYTPSAPDIAVIGLSPSYGLSDSQVPVQVLVTNMSGPAATFTVAVTNLTTGTAVGSQLVNSLAASGSTNVTLDWNIASLEPGNYLLQATASPVAGELLTDDNVLSKSFQIRDPKHDIAVAQITAPASNLPDASIPVGVAVSNLGDFTESFGLVLRDATQGVIIGSNYVSNLPPSTARTVAFSWNTAGTALGYHTLQATADAVAEEIQLSDNTSSISVVVAQGTETVVLIPSGSMWRYNDQGLDLTDTPWKLASYYDQQWGEGPAPLGYSDNSQHTNIATKVSYGASASSKQPTCYFRQRFQVDAPLLTVSGKFRRDDGFVMYLNGSEVFRTNMPSGAVTYATYANYTVSGTGQYTYYNFTLSPTNFVTGENLMAVEVHQVNASSSDIVWDLELTATRPKIPIVHNVTVASAGSAAEVVIGDQLSVGVTLNNLGTSSESVLVYLKDTASNVILASQSITNLPLQGSTTATLECAALGLTPGAHTLQAFTVINGVTNAPASGLITATIQDAATGVNAVNAAGSLGGFCSSTAFAGSVLLLGSGATLEILSPSDSGNPIRTGSIRLPGIIHQIAASNTLVFAACGQSGVHCIDISNPAQPVHVQTIGSAGHSYGAAVIRNLLCVADGRAGLRVYNIDNIKSPAFIGSLLTEGPAQAVANADGLAAVLDAYAGLQLVSLSNPQAPARIGNYDGILDGRALCVSGSCIYAVDGKRQFYVVKIDAPSAPALSASLLLGAMGESIAANGTTAYIAAGAKGLLTVNCANAAAPVLTATNTISGGYASGVACSGNTVCVASGFDGLEVFNAANPASPAPAGGLATSARAVDIAISGGIACIASGEMGMKIYSVSNPAAPVFLSAFKEAQDARCIAVSGNVAFIGDGQYGVKAADIGNPLKPALLGGWSTNTLGSIRSIAASGSKAALTDGKRILLLDATAPSQPILLDQYLPPSFVYKLAMTEGHVYAVCGGRGLLVFDCTGGKLNRIGQYDTPGLAAGIAITGNHAFIADGASGWLVLDISNPAAPSLIKSNTADGPVADVAVSGVLAALASGAHSARIVDASNILTPVTQNVFPSLVRAMRMAAAGSHAYAAEDDAGLAVLEMGAVQPSDDSDHDGLPDSWEQQIVSASSATNGPIHSIADVLPQDDFDGDGLTNYQEFLAGTSPTDPASVFALVSAAAQPGSTATVSWSSVIGKQYTVYKSTNLLSGFYVLQDNIAATPPVNTFADTNTVDKAFYIIGAQ